MKWLAKFLRDNKKNIQFTLIGLLLSLLFLGSLFAITELGTRYYDWKKQQPDQIALDIKYFAIKEAKPQK